MPKHYDQFNPYQDIAVALNSYVNADEQTLRTTSAWECRNAYPLWQYTANPKKWRKDHGFDD